MYYQTKTSTKGSGIGARAHFPGTQCGEGVGPAIAAVQTPFAPSRPEMRARPGLLAEFLGAFPAVLGPRFWHRFRRVVGLIIVLAVLRSIAADWSTVASGSMVPTLLVGDRLLINKLAYDLKLPFTTLHLLNWGNPQRGELIVFLAPTSGLRLVKRVIGLPGDIVEMRDNVLYLNGVAAPAWPAGSAGTGQIDARNQQGATLLMERIGPWKIPHGIRESHNVLARRSIQPTRILAGEYFVLGDNRDDSFDSRYFGLVDRSQILGRTSLVLISLDDSYLPRLRRVLISVP